MPKVSKTNAAEAQVIPAGEVRWETIDGYEVSFLDLHEETDLAPLLKGLPDDRCPCPHWGYVSTGRVTFTFADHEEVFEAGDAFYVGPGHSPSSAAGTEYVMFSPEEQIAEVNAVLDRNIAAMQSAS